MIYYNVIDLLITNIIKHVVCFIDKLKNTCLFLNVCYILIIQLRKEKRTESKKMKSLRNHDNNTTEPNIPNHGYT
jgi:hypothetical protein